MKLKKWFLLGFMVAILIIIFYLYFYSYLSVDRLKIHHQTLQRWTADHYALAVFIFILIYILIATLSIPGATILRLLSGLLFGIFWGAVYVVFSATISASLLFIVVNKFLRVYFSKRTSSSWLSKMEQGFKANAFYYLLILRLVPLFPFCLINIVAALLDVRIKIFILATLLGIIPSALVYVSIGNYLGTLFTTDQVLTLSMIFKPLILLTLVVITILVLLIIFYKLYKKKRTVKNIA